VRDARYRLRSSRTGDSTADLCSRAGSRAWYLVMLSAMSRSGLERVTSALVDQMRTTDLNIADVAYTLHAARQDGRYRRIVVCRDADDLQSALWSPGSDRVATAHGVAEGRSVVFMFPGGGSQYVNMGRDLYEGEPTFRENVDYCSSLLLRWLECDLRDVLYPSAGRLRESSERLSNTLYALPGLFVTEYALAKLWMSWGVFPEAMIGHSLGEYVAACLAEVISLEDALRLVTLRARLLATLPRGAMLSVALSERGLLRLMGAELSLAAINAPNLAVVSGPIAVVRAFESELLACGIECRRLHIATAGHSELVTKILDEFSSAAGQIRMRPPRIPYVSNVTGSWITAEEAVGPEYWPRHLRQTVRFSEGIAKLLEHPGRVLIEVGPGRTLQTLVLQRPDSHIRHIAISSLPHAQDSRSDIRCLVEAVGRLWLAGAATDASAFHGRTARRLAALPVGDITADDHDDDSAQECVKSAPLSPVEQALIGIWRDILGRDVNLRDNFFELGGHSLMAARLLSRVRTSLRASLCMRDLFESPTVASLSAKICALSAAPDDREAQPIPRIEQVSDCPLSFAQERLWFLDRLEPGNPFYNIARAFWLDGRLEAQVLEESLQSVAERHEVLRTRFGCRQGIPVQQVQPPDAVRLMTVDLTAYPDSMREQEAQRQASELARRPFDLGQGPLLRAALLRLTPEHHLLVLTLHHIVADGWSLEILLRELAAVYAASMRGVNADLPTLRCRYSDFAVWQRQWLDGARLADHLQYWTQQLAALPVLALPTDHPRPAIQTFHGARQPIHLPPPLAAALQNLSRNEEVTLFMTLLAAWIVVLTRYTGQTDIAIGTPIANRQRTELEGLIGFFVNMLVLRTRLDDDPTGRALLARVREVNLEAYVHQDLPFEKLVEHLQPARDLSYNPLFQVVFALQNTPPAAFALPGLVVRPYEVPLGTAKTDLTLYLWEEAGTLGGAFEYNTDLFEAGTIARLRDHFERVLEGLVADPTCRVSTLPMLGDAERRQLLRDWNATTAPKPLVSGVHQLVEEQVTRTPDHPAVVWRSTSWTYATLNARANQLARTLQELGVGPEVHVGLFLDRGMALILAQLAVLKAGGAYVPLDPTYPRDRLALMLSDAQVRLLLSEEALLPKLPPTAAHCICIDRDWPQIAAQTTDNLPCRTEPANLAYVIYTSGSTGRPKGVLLTHAGLMNLIQSAIQIFGIGPGNRVLQFASASFDASVLEIYVALASGSTLEVPGPEVRTDADALGRFLRDRKVTMFAATPPLLDALPTADFPDLQTLLVGAEKCSAGTARRWASDRNMFNVYAPTEATIFATIMPCDVERTEAPSIGRPIAGMQAFILDRHLRVLPIGVPGELYLGGVGLARGYLNQPQITADRFLPHPFGTAPGARLYRTGDIARWLPDGTIEFVGRRDSQIKVRGFRVELEEVEAVLTEHPAVKEAAVLKAGATAARLVAFATARDDSKPAPNLRDFLRTKLPEYMVPSVVTVVDALPRTASGKIDRTALARRQQSSAPGTAFVAPRSATEACLLRIWTELLDAKRIGVHDNFFELGGHSLMAMRLISRIRDVFHVELPARALFEAATIALLAEAIGARPRVRDGESVLSPDRFTRPSGALDEILADVEDLSDEEAAVQLAKIAETQAQLNPE
jgi:amino acid adenylation domain-containing protein